MIPRKLIANCATRCPLWGYPTEDAYYRDASSTDAVLAIRIPFLAIHAVDDPIAVDEAVPYAEFQANPHTAIVATSLGGHLCWFEIGGGRWFSRPVSLCAPAPPPPSVILTLGRSATS